MLTSLSWKPKTVDRRFPSIQKHQMDGTTTAGIENGRSHKKGPQLTGQEETGTSFLQAPGAQRCQGPESPWKWILPQALPRRQPGQQPDFDPVRPKTGQTSHWPTVLWDRDLLVSVSWSVCPTLCVPMDCSPPGSSVHGILQARTLELGCHAFL